MTARLPSEDFRFVVRATSLCALDLIIENNAGEVLLGLRSNPPAQGFWFVPGGRIYKNERIRAALWRLLEEEIGLAPDDVIGIALQGLYDHIYEENYSSDSAFNTHYIVGACRIALRDGASLDPDSQHTQIRFFPVAELQSDARVHRFVKYYFMPEPPNGLLARPLSELVARARS